MNNKKICAFIFGLIPMTLIQYCYWNWSIKSWTVNFDNVYNNLNSFLNSLGLDELFIIIIIIIIPIIIVLIYFVYETFIIFSKILVDTSFRDRLPLAILWILESVIGTDVSTGMVSIYEKQYNYGFRSIACLFSGWILILSFLICRTILFPYIKGKKK